MLLLYVCLLPTVTALSTARPILGLGDDNIVGLAPTDQSRVTSNCSRAA